ncbi:MAG: glycosyltransferase [Acidimicrobiia bacterium]|nr:glycosyltransferase [Acidimicrobiia bacterium]
MADEATVVLVVPIPPAATGNGLAMRAGMLLDALAPVAAVHLVIVPVSGAVDDLSWAADRARAVTVIDPIVGSGAREHTTRQLADPALRVRLERTAPLPARAALAPPTLATAIIDTRPRELGHLFAVLAMRLYLAPLGTHLARILGAGRVVVDADDDDAALLRALGAHAEADAFERLARCWLPEADAVLAASAPDAAAIAARAGLEQVHVVPNAVPVPAAVPPAPGADRLLFLGNLTYEPNRSAARALAREILPALWSRRPIASLDLVGRHDGSLDDLAGIGGVRLLGEVPDVAPSYGSADVVVVPLRHGAGMRIKILEAFAWRRPVVATPAAVAGIDAHHTEHLVIAESTDAIVRAVDDVLADPCRTAAMVDRAADLVRTRYSHEAVAPLVRTAVLGVHTSGHPGTPGLPGG